MSVLHFLIKVGDPVQDHQCWIRPENMETPRSVLQIDQSDPGTEIAAETAAALAASSVVFRHSDGAYSRRLLNRAKMVSPAKIFFYLFALSLYHALIFQIDMKRSEYFCFKMLHGEYFQCTVLIFL